MNYSADAHDKQDNFYQPELNYEPEPARINYSVIDVDTLTTDSDTAVLFIDTYHRDLKYCRPLGGWFVWTGLRWKIDNESIYELLRQFGVDMRIGAATRNDKSGSNKLWKHAQYCLSETGMGKVLKLASKDKRVHREAGDFDHDTHLLNTLSGTVDLRSGETRDHSRDDHITRLISIEYDQSAEALTWEKFLKRVVPDNSLRDFIQAGIGYSATGSVAEQVFFILFGKGSNGKSTFVEAVSSVLGDYGIKTNTDALMAKNSSGANATPDVANLKSKRFVTADETEEGARLNESLVKSLTGGDTITARYLNQNPFTFTPTHTIWLSTNHKPGIRGTDEGIWRRIMPVPFTEKIEGTEKDKNLPQKLRRERQGILAWIVQGAVRWHRDGLIEPQIVTEEKARYRSSQDRLTTFIDECCVIGHERYTVSKADLFDAYVKWAEKARLQAVSKQRFGQQLLERADTDGVPITDFKGAKGVRMWRGIGLLTDQDDDSEGGAGGAGGSFSDSSSREAFRDDERETAPPTPPTPPDDEKVGNSPSPAVPTELQLEHCMLMHRGDYVSCYVCNKDHPKRKRLSDQ